MIKFIKKIFHPKSTLYPLLLGLMSLLAIIVSLLTLQEMKTQRDLSMQPIVRIENYRNKFIHIDSSCQEMIYEDAINLYEPDAPSLNGQGFSNKKHEEWFALEMINVGQGAAVDLQIEWGINFNLFDEVFNELSLDKEIFVFNKKDERILITYKKCTSSTNASSSQSKNSAEISHLLPADGQNATVKVPIPIQMLKLQVALIKAKWLKEGQTFDNISSSQVPHTFTLKYSSVGGSIVEQKYKITLAMSTPSQNVVNGKVFASYKNFILEVKFEAI